MSILIKLSRDSGFAEKVKKKYLTKFGKSVTIKTLPFEAGRTLRIEQLERREPVNLKS